MTRHTSSATRRRAATFLAAAAFTLLAAPGSAQSAASSDDDVRPALRDLQQQVQQLRELMQEMRQENAESRKEMQELREELRSTRDQLQHAAAWPAAESPAQAASTNQQPQREENPAASNPSSLQSRVEKLEDSTSLLAEKVDEQYQTKVETASKYRARLSGIVLMNAFSNRGSFDNLDVPDYAEPVPRGTPVSAVGATLRQSEIGLEIFGPTVAGARTSADIQFDFAGGFAQTGNGVDFGLMRMQTAAARMDWKDTSLIAGQDALFISPLAPTSFASLATPTFGYAGNLWAWTPQIRAEHRFALSDQQTVTVQAGVLDNLDWEFPQDPFYRYAQAGEQSGQPAYAARTAWSRSVYSRSLSIGVAGYYGRQNWNYARNVNAWAGMMDWEIPLFPRVTLSGEFYRGSAIGGLGGATGRSIVYGTNPSGYTSVRALDDVGGWAQLKVQVTSKLELNGVFANDNAFAGDVRGFAIDANNFGPIFGRNRGMLANFVYRPRSDLLFSAELRRLRTFPIYSSSSAANQVNLAMGILF